MALYCVKTHPHTLIHIGACSCNVLGSHLSPGAPLLLDMKTQVLSNPMITIQHVAVETKWWRIQPKYDTGDNSQTILDFFSTYFYVETLPFTKPIFSSCCGLSPTPLMFRIHVYSQVSRLEEKIFLGGKTGYLEVPDKHEIPFRTLKSV